jgi:MFS family permease
MAREPRRDSIPVDADANWRRFVFFRVLFNSRFYYPVLAIFFLDLGLSATQYTFLNFAWAIAIVLTDVPAGVLADRIGRKPFVVGAAICMMGEMLLLILAPLNGGTVLFLYCLANRVLSGIAEGMASGADEALVFDSLAERNRSSEWPDVLNEVVKWQSVGMVIAMLAGSACYDPVFMTRVLHGLGFAATLHQSTTLRFPIYLNLASAVLAFIVVVGFREPALHESQVGLGDAGKGETTKSAWSHLLAAGAWILRTPLALFVVVAGLLLDSVTRLFLTFSSSYFRMIHLPAASFGILGASFAGLGMIFSPIARRMVKKFSLRMNHALVACLTFAGLVGVSFEIPIWGAAVMVLFGASMTMLGFMGSYYLNALVDSSQRATVLSFKGLAFNLGYGFIGLLFALALKAFQHGSVSTQALRRGFELLPLWVILGSSVLLIAFWRKRRDLAAKV